MLVEDDKSLREIYSIRLVAEGYNIVSANDGEEGLQMAVNEKPDLIISDVMMPKISGFDMLDILRSTPETANIKIIMMTALSSEEQRQRGENLGADRYLVKSQVGIEDVVNTVHEVLGDQANANAHGSLSVAKAVSGIPASQPAPEPAAAPAPEAQIAPAPAPAPAAKPQAAPAQQNIPHFTPEQLQGYVNEGRITPQQAQLILQQQNAREAAEAQAAQMTAPAAPQVAPAPAPAPQQPMQPGGNPVNFNQAPVAMPAASRESQPAQAQPTVGAFPLPAQNMAAIAPTNMAPQTMPAPMAPPLPMPPNFMMTPQQIPQAYVETPTGIAPLPSIDKAYLDRREVLNSIDPNELAAASQTNSVLRSVDRIMPGGVAPVAQAAPIAASTAAVAAPVAMMPQTVVTHEGRTGRRVIRPLDTPDSIARREEMGRRMAELLDTPAPAPTQQAPQQAVAMPPRILEAPAAPTVIAPQAPVAPAPKAPTIQEIMASQAAAKAPEVPQPEATPAIEQVSAESKGELEMEDYTGLKDIATPRTAAPEPKIEDEASLKQLAAEEEAEVAAARKEIEEKKAAEEAPEVVEAIQPGYVTDLAEQLNEEAGEVTDDDSMAARMARELTDDDITKVAEKIRVESAAAPKEKEEGFLDNDEEESALPEFLRDGASGNLSPNIRSAEDEASEDDASKKDGD